MASWNDWAHPSTWTHDLSQAPVVGKLLGHITGDTPAVTTDTTPLTSANSATWQVQHSLDMRRRALEAQQGTLFNQGQGAIQNLQNAANGTVPSAAELQMRQQAATDASRGFGLAAALQGRSPGMALRSAQQGAVDTGAATNANAATLRAGEQATARGQLVGAIQGQQGNTTAQGGQVTGAESNALNTGVTAANNVVAGGQVNSAAQNTADAGALGIVGGIAQKYVSSDERGKTDIEPAHLMALAKALEPFTFKYKDPGAEGAGPGERVGVMAQDAEKGGPAGRAMVRTMPNGAKGLDLGNAVGTALAMSAEALKRSRKAA